MTLPQMSSAMHRFPFTLSDLQYWILVYKDGSTTKFVYQDPKFEPKMKILPSPHQGTYYSAGSQTSSLAKFCKHAPSPKSPLYISKNKKWTISVADMAGVQQVADDFDLVIDCGDVLDVVEHQEVAVRDVSRWTQKPIVSGDFKFTKNLQKYVELKENKTIYIPAKPKYRLLQIDWLDRNAPDLKVEFWPELHKHLEGNIVTNCQGGHGRSGSTAVILMMLDAPDYSALDAIVHLRANHCPRAIESHFQHDYINLVAKFLGREANADEAYNITDYKEAWEKMDNETSKREKARREVK